jgi:hypothetical protein
MTDDTQAHRVKVTLTREQLAQALDLPSRARVVHVAGGSPDAPVTVYVEHPDLPPVLPEAETPRMALTTLREIRGPGEVAGPSPTSGGDIRPAAAFPHAAV